MCFFLLCVSWILKHHETTRWNQVVDLSPAGLSALFPWTKRPALISYPLFWSSLMSNAGELTASSSIWISIRAWIQLSQLANFSHRLFSPQPPQHGEKRRTEWAGYRWSPYPTYIKPLRATKQNQSSLKKIQATSHFNRPTARRVPWALQAAVVCLLLRQSLCREQLHRNFKSGFLVWDDKGHMIWASWNVLNHLFVASESEATPSIRNDAQLLISGKSQLTKHGGLYRNADSAVTGLLPSSTMTV